MVGKFFARKGVGFYLSCAAALCALVQVIVYVVTFHLADNGNLVVHAEVYLPSVFGVLAFVALSLFRPTEKYASAALFVLEFIAFLLFIVNGYMYLTDVFYAGFSFAAFRLINGGYLFSVIAYILALVLSGVGIFRK